MAILRLLVISLGILHFCGGVEAAGDPWWDEAWGLRRALVAPDTLPPEVDAVAVEMTTFGRLRGDGGDLRVTTRNGVPCPHRLLGVGPGDTVRFLFRPARGQRLHYVYFGNPGAAAPAQALDPQAGLLLEVRDLPSGRYQTGREVLALWDAATRVQGTTLRGKVFDGANPVGPNGSFVARYRGHIVVPRAGTYRFFTASSDASVVSIDGKVIAEWGGAHHAHGGRTARFGGAIDLEPGVHRVEYHWVKASDQPPAAVLGWQRPGALYPTLMPDGAFLAAPVAKHRPVEVRAGEALADFTWSALHHIERDDAFAVCMQFRETTGLEGDRLRHVWDFGDGNVAEGRGVRHVFFGTGPRRVQLRVERGGTVLRTAMTVDVHPVWEQYRPPAGGALREYIEALQGLEPATATAPELAAAILLADDLALGERIGALAPALLERPAGAPGDAFAFLGTRLQRPPFCDPETAGDALAAGLRSSATAQMLLALGDLHANTWGRADAAAEVVVRLQGMGLDAGTRRLLSILRGDIAAQKGEAEEARRLYEEAGATLNLLDRRAEVLRASALHAAEDYVRRKEYGAAVDLLDEWLRAQPQARLDTRCLLALGRACAGWGCLQRAQVLLERALVADPWGVDAPGLLLELADVVRAAGQPASAETWEQALLDRFPYSEEAARLEARRKGIRAEGGS